MLVFPAEALAFALALAFLPEPLPDFDSPELELESLLEDLELARESLPFSDFFQEIGRSAKGTQLSS